MKVRFGALLILFFLGMAATPVWAANSKTEILLQEAKSLMLASKDAQAIKKYEEVLLSEPACYEALCNISLLNSRIGARLYDVNSQLTCFENAWKYADAAICTNTNGAEGNYAMALAIYNKGLVSGIKERLFNTKVIKFYLDNALCENPEYADAWQLLGRWYFKNANLRGPEKAALNLFLNGAPLDATNEKAVEALQKAITYNSNNINYYYDLAIIYKEMEKPDLCEVTLQEAVDLKLVTAEELEISRRCKALLERIEKS